MEKFEKRSIGDSGERRVVAQTSHLSDDSSLESRDSFVIFFCFWWYLYHVISSLIKHIRIKKTLILGGNSFRDVAFSKDVGR